MGRGRRILALGVALVAAAAADGAELRVEGEALGTRYAVRVADPGALREATLRGAVEQVLARVDAALSTWRSDSELERFNRSRDTGWQPVSQETARVAAAARALAARSRGAFDPTVGPLVRLWGFGAQPAERLPPAPEALAAARSSLGWRGFEVRERPPALRKRRPPLELDLSGIAKGYAVDAVAARLRDAGSRHFLVELGGELRARGVSARGDAWVVGIEDPLGAGAPLLRLPLRDAALATSGPTHNFVVREGRRLSHVLDPRSGAPLETDLLSVSVVAPSAMSADGWATALLVAGADGGFALAQQQRLAALFVSARDGRIQRLATPAFEAWAGGRRAVEEP